MGEVQIAVVVPVIRRPEAAAPFMRSWRESTSGLSAVYAVAELADGPTWRAWAGEGVTLIASAQSRFAPKVNTAHKATREPWLLLVGDDVEFLPGWEQAALTAAEEGDAMMVSTNDCTGRDEILSQLAVHPMIARAYIDTVGASADGPGTVAHEGYHHWYVDQEWSLLARARGQLVYAPAARIRHLHPAWGHGKADAIYELAQQGAEADRALCLARMERYFSGGVECISP